MAVSLIQGVGDEALSAQLLPGIATGDSVVAVALPTRNVTTAAKM